MRATIHDIARLTGLAPGTVSRALETQGKYQVSTKTRQKVLDAAKQLRYRPNLIGRALVAGSTKTISFVSLAPFAEYYTQIARKISSCAYNEGYFLVSNAGIDPESTVRFGEFEVEPPAHDWLYGVDGILMCDPGSWQINFINRAIELGIPVVGLGYRSESTTDWVLVNLYDATFELITHLIAQGNRSIVMLTTPDSENEVRAKAYANAMRAHGLRERFRCIAQQRRADGRLAAREEILQNGRPDAFFCVNDVVAVGCCRGVEDMGFRIPHDVAVAGCDGIDESEYLHAPLTTIVQPIEAMCTQAWAYLRERMKGYEGPPRLTELNGRATFRASTDAKRQAS